MSGIVTYDERPFSPNIATPDATHDGVKSRRPLMAGGYDIYITPLRHTHIIAYIATPRLRFIPDVGGYDATFHATYAYLLRHWLTSSFTPGYAAITALYYAIILRHLATTLRFSYATLYIATPYAMPI